MIGRLRDCINQQVFLIKLQVSVYLIILFKELIVFVLLTEVLQSQTVSQEKTRHKNLHALVGHKTSVHSLAQKQPVTSRNPANNLCV